MNSIITFFFLMAFVLGEAQDNGKYLIRAGKLFDSESGQFKTGWSILVNQSRIEAVKPDSAVTVLESRDYQLIDLSKFAVLPGLIDAHTHLLYREIVYPGNESASLDLVKILAMDGDAYRAIYGAARAKAYLEAGITAVQDLGNSGQFGDIALKRAIQEGLVSGPRMRCSGPGLSTSGGQLPGLIYKHQDMASDEYRIVKSVDDAIQAVRENITQGADVIKIYANNTPNNTMLSVDEIKAIVREAHRYNKRVTAHATTNQAVYNAVIGGVDGIEHGYEVEDSTLELMAKRKVVLVPTDGDSTTYAQYAKLAAPGDKELPKEFEKARREISNRLQRAIRKGVTIVAGSDDYIDFKMPFAEPSKRTLIGYYESGVPIARILQFATINASRQLNWENSIGILKKGFYADIIACDGDLDQNIQAILAIHFVMKNGRIILTK